MDKTPTFVLVQSARQFLLKPLLLLGLSLLLVNSAKSQIVIALLFGDKLQSEKMEFGLNVGLNSSKFEGFELGRNAARLKLGMYIDFKINDRIIISPQALAISGYGQQNVPFYTTGYTAVDSAISTSEVYRQLNYLTLPVFFKYRIWKHLYAELGLQGSLKIRSYDLYTAELNQDVIAYRKEITKQLNDTEFGGHIGASYKLLKGEGVGIGVHYYHGFTNLNTGGLPGGDLFIRSMQFSASIPIGAKADKKKDNEE